MGGCCGLEITDFLQFLLCTDVVIFKELICNSFDFGRVWQSLKNSFFTVSTLHRCGGLERTGFNSFYLGGCCGLEKTDF